MYNIQSLMYFENVGLRYGTSVEILKNLNFSIKKGEFYFLVGESGAGKSTLLKLMNMTLKPTRGFINILGKDINVVKNKDLIDIRRKIGMIFQDYKLIEYISVANNIALPLKIQNVEQDIIEDKVNQLLQWIGLEKHKDYLPKALSGGQQQRVAIARAVIATPLIVLADEPTGSIDNSMAEKIMEMLEELNKQGTAIVFATHNLELVAAKNHKIIALQNSKIEIIG